MQFRRLSVPDAYEFSPRAFPDDRGLFVAPFQEDVFRDAVGHSLRLGQANHSVSRRGTIRGIHFADTPPGQAKYVYCPRGSLLDVVVDIRVGSPTFGRWDAVVLDSREFRAMYLAEGLGHGFVALEDDTVMTYICSEPYNPAGEHGITPLDPVLDLPWPADIAQVLSDKDRIAPTLAEAREQGLLPVYADCVAYYDKLRSAH
ncbi:dTDP-4-dehydrorhamnose 3,5-epimerase [Amycolatopsis mediterranei S699]|uniref:dTDP-4-dehydrorhamnose 3,5-epimerase n=2 Tax=Amycolatopsis mediterranei TaxID=33910 RepID=A0A0H3DHJ4_AMYMU|nr:dTDP-4-dehydrorhamnose 3,5-epimerase [Amycolatopsis mediterranei]ADJ49667.1 dTDP-4-dehydrorhamnose 3,5-epimerase [Amycolatopsis mediterranei U32]AEK46651.1 dTDP-4-dehydrorhamnose 3,5-epimerase [Amycolatopsis mediterranei S699]AFO81377.1 dTDP-4-dehydrorhamnose 3,5-epimerase [Amycolatopsis mediterranei S699]AGT88505.1 dTDP-4-dehydrorhamnose 3,5-epimerase [Amycolatopsis mediterranei RB]KDO08084.1 dTDP-4-dehydrorhamnose 3,5-epimerase [Amycolatopsis mediterranei]